jgi:hypothetical protein
MDLDKKDLVMLGFIYNNGQGASRSTIVYNVDEMMDHGHPRVNCHAFARIDRLLTLKLLYRDGIGYRLTEEGIREMRAW